MTTAPPEISSKPQSLEVFRREYNLVGIAAAKSTSKDEKYEAAGVRKQGSEDRMAAGDTLPIMSFTKAMTATLVMLLVKDGIFTWDATLESLFPGFTSLHPSYRSLDLKHLTAQRSGITETEGMIFGNRRPWQDPKLSPAEGRHRIFLDILTKPAGAARGSFKYNNANYMILGSIIDQITGSPWEEIIMDRLFKPLGMNDVVFGASPDNGTVPIGHWPNLLPFLKPSAVSSTMHRLTAFVPAANPAGGVRCTLQDCMKFLRLHADGVRGSGALGLTTDDFRFLHTPFITDDVRGEMERYTWGAWIRPFDEDQGPDHYCIWHPGGYWYFSFRGFIDVNDGACYLAMTNLALLPRVGRALDDAIARMRKKTLL